MRILFTALVPSHLLPMIPLAFALRGAGHEVLVVGSPAVVATANESGLLGAVLREDQTTKRLAKPGAIAKASATAELGEQRWRDAAVRWDARVRATIEQFRNIARLWRADIIVTDPVEFGGLIVGAALGIPTVIHRYGPDDFSHILLAKAQRYLGDLANTVGVAEIPDPAMIIDPCPPSLRCPQLPEAESIRFVPHNGVGDLPKWVTEEKRRTAVVCLGRWGSQILESTGALPAEFAAVLESITTTSDLRILFPLDIAHHHAVPTYVTAIEPLPISLLLDNCDLLVHHGGAGTTLTALAHGIPQIVVPNTEPFIIATAELVDGAGCGIMVRSVADAEAAVRTALTSMEISTATQHIRDEMTALNTPRELVPRICALSQAG